MQTYIKQTKLEYFIIRINASDLYKCKTLFLDEFIVMKDGAFNVLKFSIFEMTDGLFVVAPVLTDLSLYSKQIHRTNNAFHPLANLEQLQLGKNILEDFDLRRTTKLLNLFELGFPTILMRPIPK